MNLLCFALSTISLLCLYGFSQAVDHEENEKIYIESDYMANFKTNVTSILTKVFYMQKDTHFPTDAINNGVETVMSIIKNNKEDMEYTDAYKAIESFLRHLNNEAIYKECIKMIDTKVEIDLITESLSWMITSIKYCDKFGMNDKSFKKISSHKNIFKYLDLLSNSYIFLHFNKKQRNFLLKMFDLYENALDLSLIGNGPGHEDGIDWYINDIATNLKHIRKFDKTRE